MKLVTHSVELVGGWLLAGFRGLPAHLADCQSVARHCVMTPHVRLAVLVEVDLECSVGLTVQTVPSVLVHVPTRAAGPDVGAVAHAPMSAIKVPAKIIRRERCGFMAGIRPRGNVTRQAQISAKRLVAKDLAFNVESLRGSDTGTGSSIAKTKLVDAKLEMVRSGWLFQYCAVIRRFCLLSGLDRIQRNKIDQCLQRCAGPGQGTPCRHRGPWFAYHGRISGLRKHKRQRRFG